MFAMRLKRNSHMVTHMLKAVVAAEAMAKVLAMMIIAEIKVHAMMTVARVAAVAVANPLPRPNQVQSCLHLSMPGISF